jgi:hypothetical protein
MRTSLGYMYKFNSHHTWTNSTHDRGGNLCVDERRAGEVPSEGERDEAHMVGLVPEWSILSAQRLSTCSTSIIGR